jgi:arylsulfatase A-like enzyme/uncharacterized membrane protein YbhN (UPF0104 family)
VWWIVRTIAQQEGMDGLSDRLSGLSWPWIGVAAVSGVCGIACSMLRWNRLLTGQGIHAPTRHVITTFMIGRFIGAFGGMVGLNGYRVYDIAKHTGKIARSTATIGIEMLLGQIAFGSVIIAGSLFGVQFIGVAGVALLDAALLAMIGTAILLISKPVLFRSLARFLPAAFRPKLQTSVDAICAYEGQGLLVFQSALLGVGTHTFHIMIYVCTAHALGANLTVGQVFFASSLQILATLFPATPNGIGVREATAIALYTSVGVPTAVAFLIPSLGFAVEMFLSAFGGAIFMLRRADYSVAIAIDHPEREDMRAAEHPAVAPEHWPNVLRGSSIGLSAGLLAGVVIGVSEGIVVLKSGSGDADYGVLMFGAVAYGVLCAVLGLGSGFAMSLSGRLMQREAFAEPLAYARTSASLIAMIALGLGAFRVRRDVYLEELLWKSARGLEVLLGCVVAAVILYLLLATLVRLFVARAPGSVMLKAWGLPLVLLLITCGVVAAMPTAGAATETKFAERPAASEDASNVLFIVVDALRADHLPAYGYAEGSTPNLDAFTKDSIRFNEAFANASWTRPSFASLLSGRYPSSHKTMAKSASLPDEITTLPEALRDGGYTTLGVVTNYNVAPFFNFHQGFDRYVYLEPTFVLGANDTAAKLLLVQFLRQKIETYKAKRNQVEPGSAYQDAVVVNRQIGTLLGGAPKDRPWFLFAGYMDSHDPYYPHPYNGTGYSRAAHQTPEPEEADALRTLYDGEIAYWDEQFGHLIADLRKRDVYDAMTIIVTADHGEEFMDHGGFWHGTTLYDEQLHVPLFVKLPHNRSASSVVSHWVQSIDIMPTLLAQAGIAIPKGVQGLGLFVEHESAFAEESHEGNVLQALRMRRGASELKLITANEGNPRGLAPTELYRLDQDAHELVNLATDRPEELEIAQTRLRARASDAEQGAARAQTIHVAADSEAQRKLQALGYASDGEQAKP